MKTHKTATFKSTKVEKDGAKYKVTGDLTLLGKTKSISFPAEIKLVRPEAVARRRLQHRPRTTSYGMTYGKGKVDDKVDLSVKVDAK